MIDGRKCFDGLEWADVAKRLVLLRGAVQVAEACEDRRLLCELRLASSTRAMDTVRLELDAHRSATDARAVRLDDDRRKTRLWRFATVISGSVAIALGASLFMVAR